MDFTKHRATIKEVFSPAEKFIYFDALDQSSKTELAGYTDRKFKAKYKNVARKHIVKTEVFTGFLDRVNTPIYVGDSLEHYIANDGTMELTRNKVGYRNGFFMVDTGYAQGEFNDTMPLYHFLRETKSLVVKA